MAHLATGSGSLMHALIENNVITALRDAPSGGAWEDDQWLDFTDPDTLAAWEEAARVDPPSRSPRAPRTPTRPSTTRRSNSWTGCRSKQWKSRPWNAAEVGGA
jgi:hypothetical protein